MSGRLVLGTIGKVIGGHQGAGTWVSQPNFDFSVEIVNLISQGLIAENGLFKIDNSIFKVQGHIAYARAVEYATKIDEKLKHYESTLLFNSVCYQTSRCSEKIYIEREKVQYKNAPVPRIIYKLTCSADDRKSEFWMHDSPFPNSDKTERGREFIKWCRDILEVYKNDPFV